MRMVATKTSSVTDPVKPATLGKKFKANVKINRSVGEKTKSLGLKVPTKLSSNGLEVNGNHKVFNATLPPRWMSTCAPSNFKFSKDLKSSSIIDAGPKHSTPARKIKNKLSGGEILQPMSAPSFDNESQNGRISKHPSKPRLRTNSSVVLSQKLKSKELEINTLKHQLWLGDSHQVATESKSNVIDVLQAFSLQSKGKSKSSISEPVQDKTSIEKQRKLIQEVVWLKTDNNKKDEEKMLLQQELLQLKTKIENMQIEINLMKTDLKNKDIELLEALTDKNQEIFTLKQEKCQPERDDKNHALLNNEIQKHSLGAVITADSDDDTINLEKLTAEFLGKVSDLCPQSNIKVRAESKDEVSMESRCKS